MTKCYAKCMAQMVARLDEGLADAVDELVQSGAVASRSEAVRKGLEWLVDTHRRRQVGLDIAEGYRLTPQAEAESGWSDQATTGMITDEPW